MTNGCNSLVSLCRSAVAVAVFALLASSANASDVIASWQSADVDGAGLLPSFSAPFVSVSPMSRGVGINAATSGGLFGASGFDTTAPQMPPFFIIDPGIPRDAGDYFEWSVENTSNSNVFIDEVQFAFGQFNAPGANTTYDAYFELGNGGFAYYPDRTSDQKRTIPFSEVVLTPGEALTMRLYFTNFEEAGDPYTGSVAFKNEWSGQAVRVFGGEVPEPSSSAAIASLLGCGVGFCLRRRPRANRA